MGSLITWPLEDLDLKQEYGLADPSLKSIKNHVLRFDSGGKDYALKQVANSQRKLQSYAETMHNLATSGFTNYPQPVPNNFGRLFAQGQRGSYLLSEWFEGHTADFRAYDDLITSAKLLGKLHFRTRGWQPGNNTWALCWTQAYAGFKQLEQTKNYPKELEDLLPQVIYSAHKTLSLLKDPEVAMILSQDPVLCHHNLSRDKFLINQQSDSCLVNFEHAGAGVPQEDLAQLLQHVLQCNQRDSSLAIKVLAAYYHEYPLSNGELGALLAFLYFPQIIWSTVQKFKGKNPRSFNQGIKKLEQGLSLLPQIDALAKELGF